MHIFLLFRFLHVIKMSNYQQQSWTPRPTSNYNLSQPFDTYNYEVQQPSSKLIGSSPVRLRLPDVSIPPPNMSMPPANTPMNYNHPLIRAHTNSNEISLRQSSNNIDHSSRFNRSPVNYGNSLFDQITEIPGGDYNTNSQNNNRMLSNQFHSIDRPLPVNYGNSPFDSTITEEPRFNYKKNSNNGNTMSEESTNSRPYRTNHRFSIDSSMSKRPESSCNRISQNVNIYGNTSYCDNIRKNDPLNQQNGSYFSQKPNVLPNNYNGNKYQPQTRWTENNYNAKVQNESNYHEFNKTNNDSSNDDSYCHPPSISTDDCNATSQNTPKSDAMQETPPLCSSTRPLLCK